MSGPKMTKEEFAKLLRGGRNPHKYRAKAAEIDGVRFSSCAEGQRYQFLKILLKAGYIKDLVLQPQFIVQEAFKYDGETIQAIKYIADFMYTDRAGRQIVEDVKGFKTKEYLLKRKLFLAKYGQNYDFKEIK